jgi:hypothetical protein
MERDGFSNIDEFANQEMQALIATPPLQDNMFHNDVMVGKLLVVGWAVVFR